MAIFHLVYCSTAVRLFPPEELDRLLIQSRDRNAAEGITGLLLYHQGGFMQALEGPEENVRRVFRSILRDTRHHDVTVVLESTTSEREFDRWDMAFRNVDRVGRPDGYSDFLNGPWNPAVLGRHPGECHDLLMEFRETLRA